MDYKQRYAIQQKNEQKIKSICPTILNNSGIYILTREEEGIRYAYIGQAKKLITRLAQHLVGYQHIDLSLKKHKFYSADNVTGYKIEFTYTSVANLDEQERAYIRLYANKGFQLLNHTLGGQDNGKKALGEPKSPKGYRDGLKQGYKNAQKEVSKLFEKNLTYSINGKPNKLKERALEKFKDFLLTMDDE